MAKKMSADEMLKEALKLIEESKEAMEIETRKSIADLITDAAKDRKGWPLAGILNHFGFAEPADMASFLAGMRLAAALAADPTVEL